MIGREMNTMSIAFGIEGRHLALTLLGHRSGSGFVILYRPGVFACGEI